MGEAVRACDAMPEGLRPGEKMRQVLLIVLILILVGALPMWPYSSSWGYYPSGGTGLIVAILLILYITGRL
jgi:hypothetical protein